MPIPVRSRAECGVDGHSPLCKARRAGAVRVQHDMDRIISYRLGPPRLVTHLLPPTTRYANAPHADKHRPDPPGLGKCLYHIS